MTAVSVIIPTHNRRDLLLATLHALGDQDYDTRSYQIVVALDRCHDGTLEAIRDQSPGIIIATPSAGGKAAALNAGIAAARGSLAVFVDDDVLPVRNFISSHVNAHCDVPDARLAVTGYSPVALTSPQDGLLRSASRRFEEFHRLLAQPGHRVAPTDLNGANFSIKLDDIRSIGGFNEHYFFQRDDFELATRLIEAGFTIAYCAAAEAVQRITITAGELIGRAAPRARNDLRLALEHPWCVPYLPFHRALGNRGALVRWRILWHGGGPARKAAETMALTRPANARLVSLAYTAKYVEALREAVGDWKALLELAQAKD